MEHEKTLNSKRMKKYILLVVAAVSMIACNNEDNYIDEPVAAHISATIGENFLSRASNKTWAPGDNIGISMSGRYTNMKYTTENGDGMFGGTTLYFKNKHEPVTMTAYYPYTGNENGTPDAVEVSTTAERQNPKEHPKFDFLYAKKENVTGSDPNVKFTFSHMMSKITLIFINGNLDENGYAIDKGADVSKITYYQIDGLILDGKFDTQTGVCAAKTGVETKPLLMTTTGVVSGDAVPSLIVFPQTTTAVSLKIHDSENQDYSCSLNFGDAGIVAGNNYEFRIKVNKTGLSVNESSITEWYPVVNGGEDKDPVAGSSD